MKVKKSSHVSTLSQRKCLTLLTQLLSIKTGNKTLCDYCNSKAARKSTKKKEKSPEDEEVEHDGTPIPIENTTAILVFVPLHYILFSTVRSYNYGMWHDFEYLLVDALHYVFPKFTWNCSFTCTCTKYLIALLYSAIQAINVMIAAFSYLIFLHIVEIDASRVQT